MDLLEWVFIGLGLSMDAAAAAVCKGLAAGRATAGQCLTAGLFFGGFQALMPAIGYALGSTVTGAIDPYDHWVTCFLLALIGGNMLWESCRPGDDAVSASFSPAAMLPLAVATSIDAMAAGVSFSFCMNRGQLLLAVTIIGGITLLVSALAVRVGAVFGARYRHVAERVGGCILLLIGVKILLEGLNCWPF